MSWTVHSSYGSRAALDVTPHHAPRTHLLLVLESVLLTLQNLMRTTGKQLAATQPASNGRERSFDAQALHMMV